MNSTVLGGILLLAILIGGGFLISQSPEKFSSPTETIEKENPTPTPEPEDRVASGYVAGHVTIGPNCPGPEREGEPCGTPPEAYSSRKVIVYDSDGATVNVEGKIDANGNYKIPLGPGKYFIQIEPAGIGAGEKKPVAIRSFETSVVNFDIDTGIR